jgi:hypothetical protein
VTNLLQTHADVCKTISVINVVLGVDTRERAMKEGVASPHHGATQIEQTDLLNVIVPDNDIRDV